MFAFKIIKIKRLVLEGTCFSFLVTYIKYPNVFSY